MNGPETTRVSFCMTTYKRPEILKKTLQTLRDQTYPHFYVIVSDNDPEQSAKPIVDSLNDSRFRYFANKENLGMIRSFNKSIERTDTEFIVMLADDDPVYPDMLETLFNLQQEYPGYGMYLGGCDWFCKNPSIGKLYNFKVGTNSCLSNEHEIDFKHVYTPGEFLKQVFSFGIFPHYLWSTGIVKREVLLKMGGVPDYGTPFLGDYAFISVMGAHSGCVIINRSLGCQVLHNENFGRSQNEQLVTAAKNFPAYIEEKVSHLPEWPEIKTRMHRFTALWLVSHMSFLHNYYKKTGKYDKSLIEAEKSVFRLDLARKYRVKYFMKKNFPGIHDYLVKMKKRLS
jgi:glycosyltransferase involved in cell wall biosynthesis